MKFDICIGIDYSGAKKATSRTAALQVYQSRFGDDPGPVPSPSSSERSRRNWCRREIANWLVDQARLDKPFIAGIDHGFSFPISYWKRHGLTTWDEFLIDFAQHWPTDQDNVDVETLRQQRDGAASKRIGSNQDFRLTERWTSSAKSVFQFDVQGSVARSTHAGLPWLLQIRQQLGDRVHFWPFDGWTPAAGRSVIAEIYPSIFRNRYPRRDRSCDQQDAYSVSRWLLEMSQRDFLERYFDPPLSSRERSIAELEGWILGIA